MHRCIHPSFTYSFIFLFNVCCRNSISSTLTFDDATSKIRFSSIKTILSRSFCADSFICLVVFVCKKAHHTHTQHQSITTSQHHTRYYIHTNCHSAAKTVVIITDRLVFFFLLFGCRQRHLYLPEKRGRRYVLPWSITNRHCFPTTTRTFYAAGCFFFFLFLFCSIICVHTDVSAASSQTLSLRTYCQLAFLPCCWMLFRYFWLLFHFYMLSRALTKCMRCVFTEITAPKWT